MWEILLGLVAYSQKNAAMINNPAFKFHFYGIYPSKIPQIRIYLYSNTNYTSTLFFRRSLGRIRQFSQIRALPHDASPTWLLWVLPHVSHASKYRHSTEATHEARLTSFVSFCDYSPCLHLFAQFLFWIIGRENSKRIPLPQKKCEANFLNIFFAHEFLRVCEREFLNIWNYRIDF